MPFCDAALGKRPTIAHIKNHHCLLTHLVYIKKPPFLAQKVKTAPAGAYIGAGFFDGSHWLVDAVDELADMLKVAGHLGGEHHVDDGLAQRSELIPDGSESVTRQHERRDSGQLKTANGQRVAKSLRGRCYKTLCLFLCCL